MYIEFSIHVLLMYIEMSKISRDKIIVVAPCVFTIKNKFCKTKFLLADTFENIYEKVAKFFPATIVFSTNFLTLVRLLYWTLLTHNGLNHISLMNMID